MANIRREYIQKAASTVGRSERTIRRWAEQGVDIRDGDKLKSYANKAMMRSFGRNGRAGRVMGKKGGSRTSDAKRSSSRQNGRHGGRPKDGMELLNGAIDREAVALSLKDTPDTDLKAIWRVLDSLENCLDFLIGDALVEIGKRGGEKSVKLSINQSHNPARSRKSLEIALVYPPGSRFLKF
jgi:hypothetical protein